MQRHSILASGLLFLALALVARPSPAFAEDTRGLDDAQVKTAPASEHGAVGDHGAGGAAAAHAEAEPDILEFKPSLAITTLIVFLVLLGVLWKFAWGPLSEALAERERKQEETLRLADEARSESARLLLEHKKQMDNAAEQVRQLLDEARRQADVNAQTIVQKAQSEAEASRERAEREIGTAKNQALNEIWSKTADLAVSVAGKVLSKQMTGDDHRRLVEAAVGELPAMPNGQEGRHA